jgi:leucyl-tRNA synthetase
VTLKDTGGPKYYVLEMFPLSVGNIHMNRATDGRRGGAVQARQRLSTSAPDGLGRLRHAGREQPWNAASIRGWTYDNIARMREQLKLLDLSLDWWRGFRDHVRPEYYGKQAWFLQLYPAQPGLSLETGWSTGWDPVGNTVPGQWQVIDRRSWRSGAVVEKHKLNQWFLRISYTDDLIDGHEHETPGEGQLMQNWIGRSKGFTCR